MTTNMPNDGRQPGTALGLVDVVALLGHRRWTSIMQKELGADKVVNHHVTPGIVPALVDALSDGDVWYGVNEIIAPPAPARPGERSNGRATEKTVARWCAIWADLDIKSTGCPDVETAERIIADLSTVYGQRPTYVVSSGHGLQPVWVLDHTDPATDLVATDTDEKYGIDRRAQAAALLRRHGRLVQATAVAHGAKADSVFDLPRVLRAPGTTNHKNAGAPVSTSAVLDTGAPLTVVQVRDALEAAGIDELPVQNTTVVVSSPSNWRHRPDGRCGYADKMIDGWAGDNPDARHPWLLAQATRIAAARRYGCLTTGDAFAAERELAARFAVLCNRSGDTRAVGRTEVPAAVAYGQDLVATMTDARVASELGDHKHGERRDDLAELRAIATHAGTTYQAPAPAPAATPGGYVPQADNAGIDWSGASATSEQMERFAEYMHRAQPAGALDTAIWTPDGQPVTGDAFAGHTADDSPADLDDQATGQFAAPTPTISPDEIWGDKVEQIESTFEFWTSRESLNTVYRAALSSEASPWATLGIVLLRVIAAVPHDVYLPSLGARGPRGSLNLFCGIAAKSGGGKGLASGVAAELYRHPSIHVAPPGSGEGIGHLFGRMVTDKETKQTDFEWSRRTVLIDAPEVEALGAIGGRKGSTADAILRQAFSGETLGFSYAAAEKRLRIPGGQYRFTMMVGVQPEVAGALFDGSSGGTPQRFLWLPAEDHRLGLECPEWDGEPITGYRPEYWDSPSGGHVIDVTRDALNEIREDRRRRGRRISLVARPHDDGDQVDNLDAHALYVREKVAAALAILDGREFVTDDDWWLSAAVLSMSLMTRDGITEVMESARLRDAEKRGQEKGAEQIGAKATATEIDDERLGSTRRRVVSVLAENGRAGVPRRDVMSRMAKSNRPYLTTALAGLEEDGLIEQVEVETTGKGGRPGVLYRLVSE
ncbi:DNA primase [Gordonia phage Bock]|nr:DNA primase [Gordonia phage Bock]